MTRGAASWGWVYALALASGALILPATALAHPLLDRGQRLFEEADFQGALDAYAQAEQGTDLSRDDLVTLYRHRALVHQAMGNTNELELDVFRLANLEPNLRLGNEVPPAVTRAFEEAKGRVTGQLRIAATSERMPGGVRVHASVENDLAALVQAVRVTSRADGGEWRTANAAEAEVPARDGAPVEYFAEAIGPGGAVVAWAGTRSEPLRFGEGGAGLDGGGGDTGTIDTGGGISPWPFVIGGVVLAAGAVVLVVLLGGGTNDMTAIREPGL